MSTTSQEEKTAIKEVYRLRAFYSHLIAYIAINLLLLGINLYSAPHNLWVKWVALGWGIGIIFHAARAFNLRFFFAPDWEKKQIDKRLEK